MKAREADVKVGHVSSPESGAQQACANRRSAIPGIRGSRSARPAPTARCCWPSKSTAHRLRFQRSARDASTRRVEVSIVAADERARVQGEDRQEFDLRLQPDTYQRVRRTGVRHVYRG